MSNWKIGIRMAVGFGVVILVTVMLGIFAYTRVNAIDASSKDAVENAMPSIYIMGEIKSNVSKSYALQLRHAATLDPQEIAKIEAAMQEEKVQTDGYFAKYEKDMIYNDKEKGLIKEIRDAQAPYRVAKAEALKESQIGTPTAKEQAMKMFLALEPLQDKYLTAIDADVAFNQDLAVQFTKEITDSVQAAHMGILISLLIALLAASAIAVYITRGITLPLGKTVAVLEKVAEGDMTVSLDVNTKDEIGRMATALNNAVEKLNSTLQEVAESAANASTSSQQLAASSESIASGAQEQAASLEETSASLEQITAAVRQSADNAQQASQLAVSSKESAEKGQQVVSSAITAMTEINVASAKISDIISTIDEIAFQTNLLAVNAAVEAARAGDEGRGFAVVATEVRSLAQRSAVAAKEIKVLIQDSLRKVEAGSVLVNRSGETLLGIVGSVKRVTDIVGEIAAASGEQSSGIEQVNKAITQMDQVTQSNSAQTEELSATAQSMNEQAAQLMNLISSFTLTQDGRSQRERDAYMPRMAASANFTKSGPAAQQSRPERQANKPARAIASQSKTDTRPKRAKAAVAQLPPVALLAAAGAPSAAAGGDASFEEF